MVTKGEVEDLIEELRKRNFSDVAIREIIRVCSEVQCIADAELVRLVVLKAMLDMDEKCRIFARGYLAVYCD